MRLLIDEMWPTTLAQAVRQRGHDVLAVLERPDLTHHADEVVFEHARREGRVVLTENVPDFVPLAAQATASGEAHPGLLLTSDNAFPRGHPRTLGRVVRALDAFMAAHPDDDALRGRVERLSARR